MTLLEQARAIRKPSQLKGSAGSNEEVELLLAVMRGEITCSNAGAVIYPEIPAKARNTRIAQRVFTVFRQRIADGSLQIVFKGKGRK